MWLADGSCSISVLYKRIIVCLYHELPDLTSSTPPPSPPPQKKIRNCDVTWRQKDLFPAGIGVLYHLFLLLRLRSLVYSLYSRRHYLEFCLGTKRLQQLMRQSIGFPQTVFRKPSTDVQFLDCWTILSNPSTDLQFLDCWTILINPSTVLQFLYCRAILMQSLNWLAIPGISDISQKFLNCSYSLSGDLKKLYLL